MSEDFYVGTLLFYLNICHDILKVRSRIEGAMSKIIRNVKGTRDFYPDEMAKRSWLIEKIRETSTSFGYSAYEGPALETIDLYAAKSGEELVKEQSFVFNDRGGDAIALRPELTPTLARMVAQRQNELTFPLRWWAFGPFWRYERPQKGRTREFYQWNIDLIGSDSIQADAELIAIAATFLKNIGIGPNDVKILVNNRPLMEESLAGVGISADKKAEMLHLIDRLEKMPGEIWNEKVLALGVNLDQLAQIKQLLADKDLWKKSDPMITLFASLQALGVGEYVAYDPRIIRGLDYYTGTVFEAQDVKGEFRALLGGGHYGNLVADVGGKPLPGVGFAMGDVVIMLLLEAYGLIPENLQAGGDVYMTVFDDSLRSASISLANDLRKTGFAVTLETESEKLTRQLKFADHIGAKIALVLGPEEQSTGTVMVKNLRTREQSPVARSELGSFLRDILAKDR